MTDQNVQAPPPPAEPAPAAPQPPAPPAAGPVRPSPGGKAIAALICGILSIPPIGFFCCLGILAGIPAIILGKMELSDIEKGASPIEGRGMAKAGFIMGIIGTIVTGLALILYAILMIMGVSMGFLENFQKGSYFL